MPRLAARADGRWGAAYAGQRSMTVPPGLERELTASAAKRPETRARRIARYVAMLAAQETIHPQA